MSSLQRVCNAQEKSNSSLLIVLTQAHATYRCEWSGIDRRIWNMERGKCVREQEERMCAMIIVIGISTNEVVHEVKTEFYRTPQLLALCQAACTSE